MDYNNATRRPRTIEQRGATLVEFSIIFVLFLSLIFAIMEFAMVVFDASRLTEATRAAARYAIVSDPACNIYGKSGSNADGGCIPNDSPLHCVDNPNLSIEIGSCTFPATTPGCKMVSQMNKMVGRNILAGSGKVSVSYSCSGTGDPALTQLVPVITVAAIDIKHPMLLSNILGISLETDCAPYAPPCITLPRFETSRTGENMYTESTE